MLNILLGLMPFIVGLISGAVISFIVALMIKTSLYDTMEKELAHYKFENTSLVTDNTILRQKLRETVRNKDSANKKKSKIISLAERKA